MARVKLNWWRVTNTINEISERLNECQIDTPIGIAYYNWWIEKRYFYLRYLGRDVKRLEKFIRNWLADNPDQAYFSPAELFESAEYTECRDAAALHDLYCDVLALIAPDEHKNTPGENICSRLADVVSSAKHCPEVKRFDRILRIYAALALRESTEAKEQFYDKHPAEMALLRDYIEEFL